MDLNTENKNFKNIVGKIKRKINFDCEQYTSTFINRRFEVRKRALELTSDEEYEEYLDNNLEEYDLLRTELSIHVTHFFRDFAMWNYLMKEVIPEIKKYKKEQNNSTLKIWSAGSSTGEEATTIAICLLETLGNNLGGLRVQIHGTDIDIETVEKAKKGVYQDLQFREMPKEYKEKYFEETDEGLKTIDSIKRMISFEQGDLIKISKPSKQDLIFCRNTVIYFNRETKSKLYVDIYNSLIEKGFLIMGKSEILQGDARDLFKTISTSERVFQKAKD